MIVQDLICKIYFKFKISILITLYLLYLLYYTMYLKSSIDIQVHILAFGTLLGTISILLINNIIDREEDLLNHEYSIKKKEYCF